jgi:hypothetical protein
MMQDGINRIRARNLRRRVSEICSILRSIERPFKETLGDSVEGAVQDGNREISEFEDGFEFQDLVAEKMRLDSEIRILEGKQ